MAAVRIEVVPADLTTVTVDAVVNAANAALVPGGGVDGALNRAAGPQLAHAMAALGGCAPGDAKSTPAFGLPARWVIHTVGPVWRGGQRGEAEVLASCYRRSLAVAGQLGARSVAFPAISTGVYGYPAVDAASVAAAAVRTVPAGTVERVLLVAHGDEARAILEAALGS